MTGWKPTEELVNTLVPTHHGANDQFTPFLPMYVTFDGPFTGGLQTGEPELAAWRCNGGPVTVNSLVKITPAGQQ